MLIDPTGEGQFDNRQHGDGALLTLDISRGKTMFHNILWDADEERFRRCSLSPISDGIDADVDVEPTTCVDGVPQKTVQSTQAST